MDNIKIIDYKENKIYMETQIWKKPRAETRNSL